MQTLSFYILVEILDTNIDRNTSNLHATSHICRLSERNGGGSRQNENCSSQGHGVSRHPEHHHLDGVSQDRVQVSEQGGSGSLLQRESLVEADVHDYSAPSNQDQQSPGLHAGRINDLVSRGELEHGPGSQLGQCEIEGHDDAADALPGR